MGHLSTRASGKDVTTEVDGVSKDQIQQKVLKPGGWESDAPIVEHTFTVDYDLVTYSNGAYMNPYRVGDDIYYVLSYYENRISNRATMSIPTR